LRRGEEGSQLLGGFVRLLVFTLRHFSAWATLEGLLGFLTWKEIPGEMSKRCGGDRSYSNQLAALVLVCRWVNQAAVPNKAQRTVCPQESGNGLVRGREGTSWKAGRLRVKPPSTFALPRKVLQRSWLLLCVWKKAESF